MRPILITHEKYWSIMLEVKIFTWILWHSIVCCWLSEIPSEMNKWCYLIKEQGRSREPLFSKEEWALVTNVPFSFNSFIDISFAFFQTFSKKDIELLSKVQNTLAFMLNDDNVAVQKRVMLCVTQLYKFALQVSTCRL